MSATIEVLLTEPIAAIDPNLYGHFIEHLGACIYDGIWVGEGSRIPNTGGVRDDVVAALGRLKPPIVRWPGGCFADDYHWQDGVGPAEGRPRRLNIHWGETVEANAFGTHEFIRFCRAIDAEPYLCGNVGSGTPRELRDWVEYCNFPGGTTLSDRRAANGAPEPFGVRHWGVGNESWGCGGHFTPEAYATEYRRFSTFLRDLGGTELSLIACGANGNDLDWTRRFFTQLRDWRRGRLHGYGTHYYCRTAGTATEYTDDQWYQLLQQAGLMEPLIVQQRGLMDAFDPERKVGLIIDEWGTWHPATPGRNPRFLWQQNTLRDALVAALTLDIFNRHADKVAMANIAQTINVLQALLLTDGDRLLATPTYHVYDLYRPHQGARSVRALFDAPEVTFRHDGAERRLFGLAGSASTRDDTLTLTVVNPRIGEPVEAAIHLRGDATAARARATTLTHPDIHAHNTFDAPDTVTLAGPQTLPISGGSFRYVFAPQSVTRLAVTLA
jgi:alpha-N-arabinofuranosidase